MPPVAPDGFDAAAPAEQTLPASPDAVATAVSDPIGAAEQPYAPVASAAAPTDLGFPYPPTPSAHEPYALAPHGIVRASSAVASAKGLSIAALVVGIVAFLVGWLPVVGTILGLVAVVLGILALVLKRAKGLAITGLVLGAIALVTSVLVFVAGLAVLNSYGSVEAWASSLAGDAEPVTTIDDGDAPAGGQAPADQDAPGAEGPEAPLDLSAFGVLDDASFAAVEADPAGHEGESYVVYGEIFQLDDITGPCQALASADDAQQASWEGYATPVLLLAASGEDVCPEFGALAEGAHDRLWVTVAGATTLEFDDGPADVLTLWVHQAEGLPALP